MASVGIFAAADARGDLGLRFRVSVARQGQTVVAFYGEPNGRQDRVTIPAGIRAYLVPARDRISPAHQAGTGPPSNPAWIPLGTLRSQGGTASMRFRIPTELASGVYTIGFWCIPCAPPKGATFTGSYPNENWKPGVRYQMLLRVLALKPPSAARWKTWEIATLAVAAITVLLGALVYRRRHAP